MSVASSDCAFFASGEFSVEGAAAYAEAFCDDCFGDAGVEPLFKVVFLLGGEGDGFSAYVFSLSFGEGDAFSLAFFDEGAFEFCEGA